MAQRLDGTSIGGSGGAAGTVTEAPGADPAGLPAQTGAGPVPQDPAGSAAASSPAAPGGRASVQRCRTRPPRRQRPAWLAPGLAA